jgi:hypothetical protein
MPLYAVSYIDWYDHDLTTEFHHADTPAAAVAMHSKVKLYDLTEMPQDMVALKAFFFNMDSMVEAVPVPAT